ncbi:TIGR03084 family metal-binding protein [Aeromicrobium duanguangcaii]|uniref:TIGR03084 family metal-binding protein n=1 Tax=Aeromicrobium duanguangcaii TaxID=2968086 RepID=A0ABY5KGW2_9ACTN|nr:TIGR03084 family metal-binding protein [Aeromicrobium duanguangcaii]MCD9154567.1 TIGR03084 family metal-binding protein [Aeromicrobium duanguangcaii]UUI68377.1 TIGR03084 family metal-binding protein [Aeromicrobium duanguangcaii]
MTTLDTVLDDLAAESLQLDGWVAGLKPDEWATVTTPEGWTVAHQVAHLHWTDVTSTHAINDKAAFDALIMAALENPEGYIDQATDELALEPPESLLPAWRAGRAALVEALKSVPEGQKIPWFGPPMSPVSMVTARLMETWAHSHDVAEALGISVPRTDRVKHVCHIGVRTFTFTHMMRGEEAPDVQPRVELTAPSGEVWTWGPEDSPERVTGDAWDFALLATRRRHRSDVDVTAEGPAADHWLDIVQAFAGLPGNDPKPLAER